MRTSLLVLAVGLSVAAAGCKSGHGGYTAEALAKSQSTQAGFKAGNAYQQAEQAYRAGDLDKALKLIKQSIQINPSVCKSHVLHGRILLEQADLEGALLSFQQAAALDPKKVEAQYYQGIVFERFQQLDKALEKYQAAAELEPSNPQHAVAVAEVLVDLGRIDEANTYLAGRSTAFEHNAGVRQTLGHIAMLKNDPKLALTLFTQARLLAPDDPVILEDVIHAQVMTEQYAEAEFNLSRLLKSPATKDRRDLRQMQARCLMRLDRPIEARELLIGLTNGDEGQRDVESWIELGDVSYLLRDQNRLRLASMRVIALAPHRAEGFTLKALWQRRSGDLEGALETLAKAIERRGHQTDSLLLQGLVLQELGRMEEASASFATVLAEEPNNSSARKALESLSVAGVEPER